MNYEEPSPSNGDDTTSSAADEALFTPNTESVGSSDTEEPAWLFKGSLLNPLLEDIYCPYSAPTVAVHHGHLFCLWTGKRGCKSPLYWASLDNAGSCDCAREVFDLSTVVERSIDAVGAPAIADLNGALHVVFLERVNDPPARRHMLVHMQYDDQCKTWGKRASLGTSTWSTISLESHEGCLYCGYENANQELAYSTWSEAAGWSISKLMADSQCIDHSFALYNLGGSLHMLYANGEGEERTLHDLEHETTAWCWLPSRVLPRLEEPFFGGLEVISWKGRMYIIYQNSYRRPMLMTTAFEGLWTAPQEIHNEASWNSPAITIFNGYPTCVWVGGPNSHRKLLWSQQLTTSSITFKEWMSRIDSNVYLSELSIPGSHESCATIAVPWVQCQNISIDDQLNCGVRYFDFRCGVSVGTLYLFHGRSPLGFTLSEVLTRIYAWLTRVQKEAIILQIKMEGGTGDEITFEKLLRSEFTQNAKYWALGNTIPKLGSIRGKIQLIRRFHTSGDMLGIDVRQWADNSPEFIIPLGQHERMVVQDQYEYTDVAPTFTELVQTKSSAINSLIVAAKDDRNPRAWYLNWCNAYALPFSLGVVATPADIATGRNDIVAGRRHFVPGVNSNLSRQSFSVPVQGRYGTILLDFVETPDPELIAAIVMTNTFI